MFWVNKWFDFAFTFLALRMYYTYAGPSLPSHPTNGPDFRVSHALVSLISKAYVLNILLFSCARQFLWIWLFYAVTSGATMLSHLEEGEKAKGVLLYAQCSGSPGRMCCSAECVFDGCLAGNCGLWLQQSDLTEAIVQPPLKWVCCGKAGLSPLEPAPNWSCSLLLWS